MTPNTIEDIVKRLDEIIALAVKNNSPLGYFPALYRAVTLKVDELTKKGGYFDNDARMRTMVVTFAGRYIDAHDLWASGGKPTRSWKEAFKLGGKSNKIVLQHLAIGINAHINLDLGIAVATVAPGEQMPGYKNDFNRINDVLGTMVSGVEARLIKISPWIGWLNKFTKNKDELVAKWLISKARKAAWTFANKLAAMDSLDWKSQIEVRDIETVLLANVISGPGFITRVVTWIVKRFESDNVAKNIEILLGPSA